MRVIEALDLVPEGIDLLGAVFFDLLDVGTLVDELAFLVDGHEQLARFEVIDLLTLPRGVGVEDLKILAVIHSLVVDRQIVGDGLAGVTAIEAVELLEVRCRDLADVLADLDLGDDIAVLVLHRDELIDAAEDRLALGGNETLADAEGVDLRVLHPEILNEVLVERVRNGDGALCPARLVEHLARLAGKIGDVAAVQADAALFDAKRLQDVVERFDGVGNAGL